MTRILFASLVTSLIIVNALPGADFPTAVKFGVLNNEEQMLEISGSRKISGVYPHLTTYSQSRKDGRFFKQGHQECGIGAVVPWVNKLWMITYAPHKPRGSDHKLYSIDENLTMTLHPESVGGTPAARMIHHESEQLFLGHYVIDRVGKIRVISPKKMPARVTAIMRHLKDPENFVYLYDMENMFYEINVHTLAFTKLFQDPIPGYHGKGGYTSQSMVVVSNNGETSAEHLDQSKEWKVSKDFTKRGSEDRGCLATYDGEKWKVIERRQYTEVTGPEGVRPTSAGLKHPVWSIGWDKRSLRLKVLEDGKFMTFLLPKGCLNNDASHGWFTEWPRIRDVGQKDLLMDMHGMFFRFPKNFGIKNTAGIEPVASHLRYIPDFCEWNGKLVLATDEASIQGNPLTGQPQSSLWFGSFEDLSKWGPRNAAGSIFMDDEVKAGVPSSPFLINGFPNRMVHFATDRPVTFTLQVDRKGTGQFKLYKKISVDRHAFHIFDPEFEAQWIRVLIDEDCRASVCFQFSESEYRSTEEGVKLFMGLADVGENKVQSSLLFPNASNRELSVCSSNGSTYEFDHLNFSFKKLVKEPRAVDCMTAANFSSHGAKVFKQNLSEKTLRQFLTPKIEFSVDDASVLLVSRENRSIVGKKGNHTVLRLPKGNPAFDQPFSYGQPRMHRELESERMMANIHGTFYEVPFWIVGQPALYSKMRPVSSHTKQISDFTTWNGLLVMGGLKQGAQSSEHVYLSKDGGASLWLGGIDDLWKLGKPVGEGGPWKNTKVKAGELSDPYLMTGYDQKTLTLSADKNCKITAEIDFDHWTGFHPYKTFDLKAGEEMRFLFPKGFSAHWIRFRSSEDTRATAWLVYR